MNIFQKIKFFLTKPKVIIVTGNGRFCAKETIFQVLNKYFKIGKEILIFETDLEKEKKFEFLIKYSSLPILVVTHIADQKEGTIEIRKLTKLLPPFGYLVLNFDDETVKEITHGFALRSFTFGFQEKADFYASDVILNGGTNFKINYKGNVVPIWLEKLFGKEQIYSALAATTVGTILGLNLIEISQALKNYHCSHEKSP